MPGAQSDDSGLESGVDVVIDYGAFLIATLLVLAVAIPLIVWSVLT